MNQLLRNRLHILTLNERVDEHSAALEALRAEVRHTIAIRESPAPVDRYTCAVHAFELVEDPDYLYIATSGLGKTFAGKEFIDFLLANARLTERGDGQHKQGDLIMYFRGEAFEHVGRLVSPTRVISKWGTGLLYEHDIWDVPSNYGDEVRFYVGPDADASFALFQAYAETRGFHFGGKQA